MFARNLLPGWTSWGNEVIVISKVVRTPLKLIILYLQVLKFQNAKLYWKDMTMLNGSRMS
jgi:hypothetical protein